MQLIVYIGECLLMIFWINSQSVKWSVRCRRFVVADIVQTHAAAQLEYNNQTDQMKHESQVKGATIL